MRYGEVRGDEVDGLPLPEAPSRPQAPAVRRLELEPEKVEQGLVQLVLAVVELIRQLMEKQALRRIEGGSLTPEQVEALGTTLMRLEQQMGELRSHYGITDLNIDLGPLGPLLDETRGAKSSASGQSDPAAGRGEAGVLRG